MKKNTSIRRITAIILSILLVLGIVGPVAFVLSASATGNARAAYKNTVQDLVRLYGICETGKMNTDEDARGIISVVCADMFGDSTEELFVARLEPTTVPSGDMGPTDAICTIYVFNDNQYSNESCVERVEGAYMSINGTRSGDKFLLTHSLTRMISDGNLWDGDSWLYKTSGENRTPEEQAWVDEQAATHGDGGWRRAELTLLHKNCGFTEEVQSVFSLNGQGEIKTFFNGRHYTPEECVALLYNSVSDVETPPQEPAPEIPKADISSNITPDYDKISSIKNSDDLTDYMNLLMQSVDYDLNDAAINELILFAETAISNFCTKKIYTWGNKLTLGSRFRSVLTEAGNAKKEVENLFISSSLPLNNPIDVVVPVLWKNCKLGKNCKIYPTESISGMLQGVELRLYLGDNQYFLQFTSENTDLSEFGKKAHYLYCMKERNSCCIYTISEDGEYNNPPAFIGLGLPAETATSTVIAHYESGEENIGCQYDPLSKLVFFETSTSGVYEVVDNDLQIDDISHLSSESQKAITFLVSKNCMGLTDGSFLPENGLSRYQFTQAIVGMFFAKSNAHTTTFPDVPADHPYYSYVASGEYENIVEGFDDGLYHGDDVMTVEQMLALASRTLVNKKGYTYPADYTSILNNASVDGTVSQWAQEAVAMALRDGLWEYDETIRPQDPITREQAALVLYRLFLLLQEITPATMDNMTNIVMIAATVVASVSIVICIVLIVILIKKNKEFTRRKR